jgi:hypothetical protein
MAMMDHRCHMENSIARKLFNCFIKTDDNVMKVRIRNESLEIYNEKTNTGDRLISLAGIVILLVIMFSKWIQCLAVI